MSLVEYEERNGVLLVTMNRPEKKNALNGEMYGALADGIQYVEDSPSLRVIVFTGKDGAFTAGNDLNDLSDPPLPNVELKSDYFLRKLTSTDVPLIAAVNGVAAGVGVTMLFHCDFVFAARSAKLVAPFVNLGLIPEAASTLLLPIIAGHQKSAELFMLGEPVTAAWGKEAGFVNGVCDDSELLSVALSKAEILAAKPPEAMRLTKRLLRLNQNAINERLIEEGKIFSERLTSAEAGEAFAALIEKRRPDFSNFV